MRSSFGYRGDDGLKFSGAMRGEPFGPTFTTGDVVGCGINLFSLCCRTWLL
jgi:hypothetical protein